MTTNLALASIKSAGSTATRTLGDRFSDVINVKDYGATGNGVTDDRAAIQAAFNVAYGSPSSPHGNTNKYLNKPVFIPGGHYKLVGPLYIVGAIGAHVFGEGPGATTLDFQGALTGNSIVTVGSGSEITPMLMLDGVSSSIIEGMTFIAPGPGTAATPLVGIFLYQSGSHGIMSAVRFTNILLDTLYIGVLGGWGGTGGNCDNMLFHNVILSNCAHSGIRAVHQNALNWGVYGGGGQSCASLSTGPNGNHGAVYSAVGGSISPICNPSMSVNGYDIISASTSPVTIIGGSSESINCIASNGTQFHVSGFAFRNLNSAGCTFVDLTWSGFVHLDSCIFSPGNNTGIGTIIQLGNNGIAIVDNLQMGQHGEDCVFSGASAAKLYLRGCSLGSSTPLTEFTGTVAQNI